MLYTPVVFESIRDQSQASTVAAPFSEHAWLGPTFAALQRVDELSDFGALRVPQPIYMRTYSARAKIWELAEQVTTARVA